LPELARLKRVLRKGAEKNDMDAGFGMV